ncbi:MAG: hypothetical protein GXO82_01220, partial [Chlorobi bacterium]|nr:hypothetical protein [Chlorobiota bacterium]
TSSKEKSRPPAKPAGGKKHHPEKEKTPARGAPSPGASGKDTGARIRISEPGESPADRGSRDPFADPESLRAEILKEVRDVKTEIKPEKPVKPSRKSTRSSDTEPDDTPSTEPVLKETPPAKLEKEAAMAMKDDLEKEHPVEPPTEPVEKTEHVVKAPEEETIGEAEERISGTASDFPEATPPEPGTEETASREEEIPEEIAVVQEIRKEQRTRSRFAWFWIVLILLAVLLVTTWYVGWLHKAFTYVSSLLETQKTEITSTTGTTETTPTTGEISVESPYEYYLQVSSWREMKNAEKQKKAFASLGLPAVVESHFIESKRATYYRVRLGPLKSRRQALELKTKFGDVIPAEAFVDSVLKRGHTPPLPRPVQSKSSGTRVPAEAGTYIPKYISEPTRGWAISVGAYSDPRIADREAEKLQQKGGLPAFISVTRRDGEEWYRVQVGPFGKEEDAKRYLQLVRVTYNVDAYIRRLR